MLPEEWPIADRGEGPDAPARSAGADRLDTVRVDFFLNPADRLTEQERALMTAMLHCLVGDVVDELRTRLPSGTAAANDESRVELVHALASAGLLDRSSLVRLLLRRADEERIANAATTRSGRREARVIQGLVSHADGAVAAAAMALIVARGRRRDRFGQCLLHFDDLSAAEGGALAQQICAALRGDLARLSTSAEADRLLAGAAAAVLAGHDPGNGIEALTAKLVQLLDEEGDLGGDLIVAGALEGEMTFVAHALSRASGIAADVALDELLSGEEGRAMTVLRAARLTRREAASLLAGIGDLIGIADAGQAIAIFDRLSEAQVEDSRTWLTADPAYRHAVTMLGMPRGKRTI